MNLKSLIPIGRDRSLAAREAFPFASLQREIDRLFEDFGRSFPSIGRWATPELVPSVDVTETDKEIEITAELPGLEEKDVQINVADNVLTIRGEKDKQYHRIERSYGAFARSLELPPGVNPDSIKASISKGVLTVTVPKPAAAQTKKIEVKSAA